MTKKLQSRDQVPGARREGRGAAGRGRKPAEATVIELLPNATCRVELPNRGWVIAHATGAASANFVRLRVRDKVLVELSPHDRTRGRIVKLLGKG